MPRSATKLSPTHGGGFTARKSIPADVRDEYGKWEERFNVGPMSATLARAKWREWVSEIEARITNIRAAHKGQGSTLTPLAARALAGEWYGWYIALAAAWSWPAPVWEDYRRRLVDGLHGAAQAFSGDPMDEWERDPALRARVRPVIADEAKSRQFLAAKILTLDPASEAIFLDYVTRDFFAAVALLARRARGDHGPDPYAEQFPPVGATGDTGSTAWGLFEGWIASAKPASSTVGRWRVVFLRLKADFGDVPAGTLLPEQIQAWANGLITPDRSAKTVAGIWVPAGRTVYAWGIGERLITRNPFTGWRVTVPKKIRTRETKRFTTEEIATILNAALAVTVRKKTSAAKRWCPWLAAYSGARMGELTQLRGVDIIKRDGVHAMNITPEAGSVKSGTARLVPLHEHLIEMGFLDFVKANGKGPLFYNEAIAKGDGDDAVSADPANPRRPRAVVMREHLAAWVRELGVSDPELSPNHAWRHTFKGISDRCGIAEKMTDAIVGHVPATEGRKYGQAELVEKAEALRKFPRYA